MTEIGARRNPGKYMFEGLFLAVGFAVALLWCALLAGDVVGALDAVGHLLGMSPSHIGMTLLAWGNSVDSLLGTIALAKTGEYGIAVTGIYAGPLFNVLFGTGSNLLLCALTDAKATAAFPMETASAAVLSGLLVVLCITILHTRSMGFAMTARLGSFAAIAYPTIMATAFALDYLSSAQAEASPVALVI